VSILAPGSGRPPFGSVAGSESALVCADAAEDIGRSTIMSNDFN